MQHAQSLKVGEDQDPNIVEQWLRRDPTRRIAGVLAGLFAGAVSLGIAMVMSAMSGLEIWYPAKLWSIPVLNWGATETGFNVAAVLTGIIINEAVAVFWGVVFSKMVYTNKLGSLLAMGLVWSAFSWVFIWNLFMQSVKPIFWAHLTSGHAAAAPVIVCLAYGLSLSSIAFFDRVLRK